MTLLVLGAQGQVGEAVARCAAPLMPVERVDRARADLADPSAVTDLFDTLRPAWVVNAAAYTAVDLAETERAAADRLNHALPAQLATLCAERGAVLLHFSTDYVFSGQSQRPWREDDPTGPLSEYGASKLRGEQALNASSAAFLTLRTSWVYGPRGRNFLLTMLRLAETREEVRVVNDQVGAPTTAEFLARAVCQVLRQAIASGDAPGYVAARRGTYHLSMAGETTWYDFAEAIFSRLRAMRPGTKVPRVVPISSREYAAAATRPAYSVLENRRIVETFGIERPEWRTGLAETLAALPA
jgi:dTDP-4-dehydrorhamnose reductase